MTVLIRRVMIERVLWSSPSLNVCHAMRRYVSGGASRSSDRDAVLYVHWPYCKRRCTYCNFNKYIDRNVDHERMTKCLVQETKTLLQHSGVTRINSVFFGGGTPSLALPSTISRVLLAITDHAQLPDNAEVTLEANPTALESSKLRDFQEAGINRVSIGIQSLNAADLNALGRDHSPQEALKCLETASRLFPGQVSVDLIFGRPNQTLQQWSRELKQILSLCDDHLSLYQLTLERGTQLFKDVTAGKTSVPDEDVTADMYTTAVQVLEENKFERYEVSNFARNGAYSSHNQSYWTGKQYIGVGPGAHGRFTPRGLDRQSREARIQTLEPDNWMREVERYGHATRKTVVQQQREQLEEMLMLGLRTLEGLPADRWSALCDSSLRDVFKDSADVQTWIKEKILVLDDRGLRVTSSGLSVVDHLLPALLNQLNRAYSTHTCSLDSTKHHLKDI